MGQRDEWFWRFDSFSQPSHWLCERHRTRAKFPVMTGKSRARWFTVTTWMGQKLSFDVQLLIVATRTGWSETRVCVRVPSNRRASRWFMDLRRERVAPVLSAKRNRNPTPPKTGRAVRRRYANVHRLREVHVFILRSFRHAVSVDNAGDDIYPRNGPRNRDTFGFTKRSPSTE